MFSVIEWLLILFFKSMILPLQSCVLLALCLQAFSGPTDTFYAFMLKALCLLGRFSKVAVCRWDRYRQIEQSVTSRGKRGTGCMGFRGHCTSCELQEVSLFLKQYMSQNILRLYYQYKTRKT